MKKTYIKPEMSVLNMDINMSLLANSEEAGEALGNRRNHIFIDDEPSASEEDGYKRTLW